MARYHFVVAMLKVAGVVLGIHAIAEMVQALWTEQYWRGLLVTGSKATFEASWFAGPGIELLASPILIFAAPLIARLCGERKPPA